MFLIRGSSATWSPDSKNIAFHASASGVGLPIKPDPSAATSDSDIFVANVDDLLDGVAGPMNLTNYPGADVFPNWSPDGQKIVFHRQVFDLEHPGGINQLFIMNADGSDQTQITFPPTTNAFPAWGHGHVR